METPILLGPLERAINHCTTHVITSKEHCIAVYIYDRCCPVMEVSSKEPNRVLVSFPTPEDENRSSFRNAVSSSHLEFLTIDKAKKPSDSRDIYPHRNPLECNFRLLHVTVNCLKEISG
jgi:hypothetical protein